MSVPVSDFVAAKATTRIFRGKPKIYVVYLKLLDFIR